MAKITDSLLSWFGSRYNSKQMSLAVPGGNTANTGGMVFIECINNSAVPAGGIYLFTDGTNVRYATSRPSNTNTGGDALTTATGGANTALSNLAAVAISLDLAPGSENAIDAGTDAKPLRSAYVRTSLIFDQATRNLTLTASEPATLARTVNFDDPGANVSVAYLTTSQALTTKTYNGLTVACASANQFILSSGTSSITMTEGNTDILLAAGAQIDIAGSKTLHLDTDLTVNTVAVTLNQALATTSSPTFVTITGTTFTDGTATLTAGALSGVTTIGTTGAITCRGITNTIAAINSTLAINIGADNVNLTLGTAGAASSRIYYDGDDLILWDSKVGAYTLQQLATGSTLNPSVTGNLTILDGNFTWGNAATDETAVWTLAATTVDGIQIASSNTSADVVQITANATAAGNLLHLISVDATMTTGAYIRCYDGGAEDFAVRRYGATTIAGSASGTAALTLTTGDVQITSGDIDVDNGMITVDTVQDITSYVKKTLSGAAVAVFQIDNLHTTGTATCLLINQDSTGSAKCLDITHDGDLAAITITAGAARTGDVITITMANQLAQKAINITGAATSANNAGIIDVTVTGATAGALFYGKQSSGIPATTSHIFWGTSQGVLAGATLGAAAYFEEIGTVQAGSYALYATSTANNGALINTSSVDMYALHLTGPAAHIQSILYVDGATGTGWDGAAGVGMVQINSDTTNTFLNATTSLLLINSLGTTAASQLGVDLRIVDVTTAGAGTSYAAYISTTNNYGLYVGTGAVGGGNLVLAGIAAQTAPMITLTGDTGTGWTGAATTGLIDISCDGATASATASMVNIKVGAGTPTDQTAGIALRIVDTTAASATPLTTYSVYIASTNCEALKVDSGLSVFDEGICTQVAVTDVSNPPTNANMITAFGAVATKTTGFLGFIDDAGTGTKLYLCAMVNGKYWQVELTAGA